MYGLSGLLNQTVTLYKASARDAYGKKTLAATGTAHKARVEANVQSVRTAHSLEFVTMVEVWISGDVDIDGDDKLVLPDATFPPIVGVEKMPDGMGTTLYTKVMCGPTSGIFRFST